MAIQLKAIMGYEMKRTSWFKVELPYGLKLNSFDSVLSCDKPKWIGGQWQPIEIVMIDPIGPSTSQALHQLIRNNEPNYPVLSIYALDPVGVEVEKWDIKFKKFDIDFGGYKKNPIKLLYTVETESKNENEKNDARVWDRIANNQKEFMLHVEPSQIKMTIYPEDCILRY